MKAPRLRWQRPRGWPALLFGLVALALALAAALTTSRRALRPVVLTPGPLDTTRALVARTIVEAVEARGGEARLIETSGTQQELEQVDSGGIDFALVSEAYRIDRYPHVREVAPLYVETLHLLVKEDLADAVGQSLGALRGRTVGLGPRGSTSIGLATAVLGFAGVAPAGDSTGGAGYLARTFELPQLESLVARGDRSALPDAFLYLATVPSKVALQLIRSAGYRLVPLPFAEAFRLNALIKDDPKEGPAAAVDRQYVSDTVIPAYTYQTEPAIPAEALHTLGTRLMLFASDRVSPETVEFMLDTVFGSQVARIMQPPLDPSALALPPRLDLHPGTVEYLRRDKPFITGDFVDTVSNSLSVIGALVGGGLFLWQWRRQRRQARCDQTFGTYMLRVADIERRVAVLELSATLELEPLAGLQREVLELKSEVLERFAAGELGQAVISDLITPVNAAQDHLGELILFVRENLREQAEVEGRRATVLRIGKPEDFPGNS